jgi:formamidopyrimidine-DNA glycosylase
VPELPEVEVARRSLQSAVVGKTVARVSVLRPVALRSHTPDQLSRALRGERIADVERRGKTLRFRFDGRVLVFHYMLWAVIRYHPGAEGPREGTSLMLYFSDGSCLEFRDLQLSQFHLVRADAAGTKGEAAIEPLASATTLARFRAALPPRGAIKNALTDQSRIAGIGNLWAHEILFAAGLKPARRTGTLRDAELRTLYRKMRQVLGKAVRAGGEPDFGDALGRRGRYRLMVYGRVSQPCLACGARIRGGRLGGRPTFYCPSCQR